MVTKIYQEIVNEDKIGSKESAVESGKDGKKGVNSFTLQKFYEQNKD